MPPRRSERLRRQLAPLLENEAQNGEQAASPPAPAPALDPSAPPTPATVEVAPIIPNPGPGQGPAAVPVPVHRRSPGSRTLHRAISRSNRLRIDGAPLTRAFRSRFDSRLVSYRSSSTAFMQASATRGAIVRRVRVRRPIVATGNRLGSASRSWDMPVPASRPSDEVNWMPPPRVLEQRQMSLVTFNQPNPSPLAPLVMQPHSMAVCRDAIGRLQREIADFRREPPEGCSVEVVEDNIMHWIATIIGPSDTPYEGGHFRLDLHFPPQYPFHPPQIHFLTRIYHCNITNNGYICMDILNLAWSPALTVSKVLLSILSLLSDPNPNDPLEANIANLYKMQRPAHDENARVWTDRYAKPEQAAAAGGAASDGDGPVEAVARAARLRAAVWGTSGTGAARGGTFGTGTREIEFPGIAAARLNQVPDAARVGAYRPVAAGNGAAGSGLAEASSFRAFGTEAAGGGAFGAFGALVARVIGDGTPAASGNVQAAADEAGAEEDPAMDTDN